MSSALAIAAVTACLKDLLNDGMIDHDLSSIGSFAITAQPPDRVTTGATENNQLNLFLYQVTPNIGWRNVGLPARDARGQVLAQPPLALDLHYLLTAYGAQDMNAEVLLGYAMQVLHETPALTRTQLLTALAAPAPVEGTLLPGPFGTMSAIDLADQPEQIKISPVFLSTEDLSKLWTAMQARYRPSMAYAISVVLIQSTAPGRDVLPVLMRGANDTGPSVQAGAAPALTAARAAANAQQPSVHLGDDVILCGSGLARANLSVHLELPTYGIALDLPSAVPPQPSLAARQLALHLPSIAEDASGMASWAIGVYDASVVAADPGQPAFGSNTVPLPLAPLISVSPLAHAPGSFPLQITCTPRLRDEQQAGTRLLFAGTEVTADAITTPLDPTQPTTLTFTVTAATTGSYPVRLRVDGLDSLPIVATGTPPRLAFDPQQTVVVS